MFSFRMKSGRFSTLIIVFATTLALTVGCKKEEDPEFLTLDGEISLPFPEYVEPGFTKHFNLDTLTTLNINGDASKIGYYFLDCNEKKDTLVTEDGVVRSKTFTITAPQEHKQYTSYITGYADGYYSSSGSVNFTVVSEKSITGIKHPEGQTTFTDPRDGYTYHVASANGLEWLEPNLTWKGAGVPYASCDAMAKVFGNYYSWEEARSACPDGWRLPTDEEWVKLAVKYGAPESSSTLKDIEGGAGELMADAYFNNGKMWEYWPAVNLSNASGLGVIPAGYATLEDGKPKFSELYKYALFWTSDEYEGRAVYRYFYVDKNTIFCGLGSKTDLACSVRCVR